MSSVQSSTSHTSTSVYSVSELSHAIQVSLESQWGCVQIKGEVWGVKKHSSGHVYGALKDADAVIDMVCWRHVISRMPWALEDGMEVIITGRVTSYPQRSRYQVVVESFELAGVGSLLKTFEALKQKLKNEGLFETSRKKSLPAWPRRVGIITSPTGAVIQDMLHRLRDRVPCHVMLWPVAVQGQGSVEQIVQALQGFHQFPTHEQPEIIVLARGGGSLEDLWSFNEEKVVRAIAEAQIPVISAIGHETDTTLSDYAADRRAPTPTAAAEMILPLKTVVLEQLMDRKQRMGHGVQRMLERRTLMLQRAHSVLSTYHQRLDMPRQRLDDLWGRCTRALQHGLLHKAQVLEKIKSLLESYAYQRTLDRGFCWVGTQQGQTLTSAAQVKQEGQARLHFHDGYVDMTTHAKRSPPARVPKGGQHDRQTEIW